MPPNQRPEFQRFRRYYQRLGPILATPRNSEMVTAIFSFLVVSLFAWYAIRPTVQTILFLKREIADKTVLNQKMEDKITNLIEAQAVFDNASERIPLVEEALPEVPEAVELASQINSLAAATGASISAIQAQAVPISQDATASAKQSGKEEKTFTFTVVIDGSWEQISTILKGLGSLRRILTFDAISLKPAGRAGGAGSLNTVVKLSSYYGR